MVHKRIRNLRVAYRLKQITLASYLNIRQSTYSDYENGKINLPVKKLIQLARYYSVSVDYIVGLTDYKTPH